MTSRTRIRARAGALVGVAATFVLVLNACTRTNAPSGPTAGAGTGSYVSQVNAQGANHWTCKAQGLGGNMEGEHNANGGLANDAYAGKQKGQLSLADCKANAKLFDKALAFAKRYPTKGSAAGFVEMVQHIDGMGTHNMTGSMGGPNANPFFLQYDGEGADAPLAGISWFTSSLGGPPAGFAGGNDWWHSHKSLCYALKGQLDNLKPGAPSFGVAGNEISDAECRAKGGTQLRLPGIWMGHAWIIPGYENFYDVFAGASACVMAKGKPAADDPCHNTPMSDGHEHGGGGGMPTTTRRAGATPTTRAGGATPTTRRGVVTTMPPMDHGGMDHMDH
jgi:hypothetical protein